MDFHGNIELRNNEIRQMVIQTETVFPVSANVGRMLFINQMLYLCIAIDQGTPIWYPLTNKISTYAHTQLVASTSWNVVHNLNTNIPIVQVYESNNIIIPESITVIDENNILINFNTTVSGSATIMYGNTITPNGVGVFNPPVSGENGFGEIIVSGMTWDPVKKGIAAILTNNNLSSISAGWSTVQSTTSRNSGKYYFEVFRDAVAGSDSAGVGVAFEPVDLDSFPGNDNAGWSFLGDSVSAHGSAFVGKNANFLNNQTIGVMMDFDAGILKVIDPTSLLEVEIFNNIPPNLTMFAIAGTKNSATITGNFGALPFVHTIPTGYISWDGNIIG